MTRTISLSAVVADCALSKKGARATSHDHKKQEQLPLSLFTPHTTTIGRHGQQPPPNVATAPLFLSSSPPPKEARANTTATTAKQKQGQPPQEARGTTTARGQAKATTAKEEARATSMCKGSKGNHRQHKNTLYIYIYVRDTQLHITTLLCFLQSFVSS